MRNLIGKKVAIVATDGFERTELLVPKKALENAGADVEVIALRKSKIKSWVDGDWGPTQVVHQSIYNVSADQYDALMLPGGVINADTLRKNQTVIDFVNEFVAAGKPIAAICHAGWTLIETGHVRGRTMTSWPSLKTDLKNAGAHWVDEEVVVDQGWVTSRKPDDLPAFNTKMIEEFGEGTHTRSVNASHTAHELPT